MSDALEAARKLAERLCALPEPAMRRAVLCETLGREEPAWTVRLLAELYRGARLHPGPPFGAAATELAVALSDPALLSYEQRAALYQAARTQRLEAVARLFFDAKGGPADEPDAPEPERVILPGHAAGPAPAPVAGQRYEPQALRGKPLTLGERKALARGGRREILQRLMRDPDEAVIKIVLENPKLTENDVVLIAARRPVRRGVLASVFHSKWLARYRVKRALVLNPYTPTDLAIRIVPTLLVQDLRAVVDDPSLSMAVRAQADLVLRDVGAAH